MQKGYKKVYWFKGGISEWRRFNYPLEIDNKYAQYRPKKLSPAKVMSLLQDKDVYILDVRPMNFAKGPQFISGAHHFPLLNIVERLSEFPKDKPIIISDWAMRQSLLAAKYLMGSGFENIVGVVKGGIERWVQEGLPIEERIVTTKQ